MWKGMGSEEAYVKRKEEEEEIIKWAGGENRRRHKKENTMNHLFKCSFFSTAGCPLILVMLLVLRNMTTFVFDSMSETTLPKSSFS